MVGGRRDTSLAYIGKCLLMSAEAAKSTPLTPSRSGHCSRRADKIRDKIGC